jgi:hypothetical protein
MAEQAKINGKHHHANIKFKNRENSKIKQKNA